MRKVRHVTKLTAGKGREGGIGRQIVWDAGRQGKVWAGERKGRWDNEVGHRGR